MDRVGYVYYADRFAGTILETVAGYEFIYDSVYCESGPPIGYRFPLDQLRFFSPVLFPFFQNLLAEGWLLKLQSDLQNIDPSDAFGLLLANGRDMAGAVSVLVTKK